MTPRDVLGGAVMLAAVASFAFCEGKKTGIDEARLAHDRDQVATAMKERDVAARAASEAVSAVERNEGSTRRTHDRATMIDSTHVAILPEDGTPARVVEVPIEVTHRVIADSLQLMRLDDALAKTQVVTVADARVIADLQVQVADLEHIKTPKLRGASAVITGAVGGVAVGGLLGGGVGALVGAPLGALFGFGVHVLVGR